MSKSGNNDKPTLAFTLASDISKDLAFRVDQRLRVCIKPKPRLLTEKMWLKLASRFIYIEKTEPSFTIKQTKGKED